MPGHDEADHGGRQAVIESRGTASALAEGRPTPARRVDRRAPSLSGGDEMTQTNEAGPAAERRPSDELRPPRRCALYVPGHAVHFIQARHGWEQPELRKAARLVAIEGNLLVFQLRRGERRYRNHEPERLAEAVE